MADTPPTLAYPPDLSQWIDDTWRALVEKEGASGLSSLTERERVFYLVNNLYWEVGNGGISQYYFNSSGDNAREVVAALQSIGATSSAELVTACNRAFPDGVPRDRDARIEALNRLSEEDTAVFATLDDDLMERGDDFEQLYHFYITGEATTPERLRREHPELYGDERFLASVAAKPAADQFRFWLALLEQTTISSPGQMLEGHAITRFDIARHIEKGDHFEIAAVLSLIAKYIDAPQLNQEGSPGWEENGAFTKESDLVDAALGLLKARAAPESHLETQLQAWLVKLHQEGAQQDLIGSHLAQTARVLHKLWPRKYPKPQQGGDDNKLLNARAFLKHIGTRP